MSKDKAYKLLKKASENNREVRVRPEDNLKDHAVTVRSVDNQKRDGGFAREKGEYAKTYARQYLGSDFLKPSVSQIWTGILKWYIQ